MTISGGTTITSIIQKKLKGLRAKAKKLAGLGIEFTLTKLNIRNKELDELMRPSRSEQELRLIDRDLNFFKCHLLDDFNVLGGIDTTNPFLGHAYKERQKIETLLSQAGFFLRHNEDDESELSLSFLESDDDDDDLDD
jgi:hypothetical protein